MSNGETLKAFTRHMVKLAGGPKFAAERLGVSQNDISNWCNPDHPRFIPVDHLLDLNALTDDSFLRELAHMRGFELTPVKDKQADLHKLMNIAAELAKDAGLATHEIINAADDGEICTREEREIRSLLCKLSGRIHDAEAAL